MTCKHWNDEWVAHLYDELEAEEERTLAAHLENCAACRATLDELETSRRMMQECAPVLPSAPRVLVLRPGPSWSRTWAFGGGVAAALLLFVLGLTAAPWLSGDAATADPIAEETVLTPESGEYRLAHRNTETEATVEQLQSDVATLAQRLARLEQGIRVSPSEFREEMGNLERRIKRERTHDLEYVTRSIAAAELRTGSWMAQTQDEITLLALRQDPRFSEQ